MEQVHYLVAYRRKLRIKQRSGKVFFFKSRLTTLDAFAGTGDAQTDLKTAFNRAEDHELFRAGWSVICIRIKRPEFIERMDEILGQTVK